MYWPHNLLNGLLYFVTQADYPYASTPSVIRPFAIFVIGLNLGTNPFRRPLSKQEIHENLSDPNGTNYSLLI